MLMLTPGPGEGETRRIITAEKIVRMHRGARSDQMTGTVSRKDHESPLSGRTAILFFVEGTLLPGG